MGRYLRCYARQDGACAGGIFRVRIHSMLERPSMTRRVTLRALGILLALSQVGCSNCSNGDRTVPFRLNETSANGTPSGNGEPTKIQRPARPPFPVIEGTSLPKGTVEIEVDGIRIQAAPFTLASVVSFDFDSDGDRDALAVALGENGQSEIQVRRRNGSTFETQTPVPIVSPDASCVVEQASLRVISQKFASAHVISQCGLVEARSTYEQALLLSLEGAVQQRERILIAPPTPDAPQAITVAFQARDVDGDDRDEVLAQVHTATPLSEDSTDNNIAIQLELPWFDRPAGLARDVSEPDASLLRFVTTARSQFVSAQTEAERLAQNAADLFDTVCRNGDIAPRLRIGASNGLACTTVRERAIAGALVTIARAKQNDPLGAWNALRKIPAQPAIDQRLQNQLQRALAALPFEAATIDPPPDPTLPVDPTTQGVPSDPLHVEPPPLQHTEPDPPEPTPTAIA